MTTANTAPKNSSRTGWLAVALLTFVIIVLHGWLWFHAGAFCGDEVNVINLAGTHSLVDMTHDSFPILLPLLVSGWSAIGLAKSDLSLRLFGTLVGLGLIGALWLSAWTARRSPPLWGLIIYGLNATAIFWTDYLRAYGLGSLLILLTLAAMAHLLERPTWKRTAVLAMVAVLSVQALYQNAVFFAGICLGGWLVCWLRKDQNAAVKIFAAAMAAAGSLLPYLTSVLRWQKATTIRPGFSLKAVLDNLHTILAFPLPQYPWLWVCLGVAAIGLGVASLMRPRTLPKRIDARMTAGELQLFAAAILTSSLIGYFLFLHHAALITSPWYFLPLMAVAAACFDLSLVVSALPRALRTVVWGILIGTALLSVPFAVRDLSCRFSNMDLVASRLKKEVSAQDYVVVTPWYLGISFSRYYQGPAAWDSLPPVADHSTYRFDLVPVTSAENAQVMQPGLDRITTTLQKGHRVWVVGWMRIPAPGRTASTLVGRLLAEHSGSFESVDLKIKGQTSDYEDVTLLEAGGWRTNSP